MIHPKTIEEIMAACGGHRVESVPGLRTGVVSWTQTRDAPADGIQKEFPGLHVTTRASRTYPGQPMTVEYEVRGPLDAVHAFVSKYGNDNLKAEMGLL